MRYSLAASGARSPTWLERGRSVDFELVLFVEFDLGCAGQKDFRLSLLGGIQYRQPGFRVLGARSNGLQRTRWDREHHGNKLAGPCSPKKKASQGSRTLIAGGRPAMNCQN